MGWSYDFWKGNFYPKRLTAKEFLGYYARQFGTVEVDSTFYRIPRAQTVTEWKMQTPQGFLFSLKFPQVITHVKMLKDCQEETKVFLERAGFAGRKTRGSAASVSTHVQATALSTAARIPEDSA